MPGRGGLALEGGICGGFWVKGLVIDNSSNNLRQQLLAKWTYPPLEKGILTVAERNGAGLYGGRISSLNPLEISWDGVTARASISELPSELDLGDLVLAEFDSGDKILSLKLLVPNLSAEVLSAPVLTQKKWSQFVELMRQYFLSQSFSEILTPTLVDCPGTEPYLKPFTVQLRSGSQTVEKYLPTSPEINLKKYLARGHSRIFEMKNCFRNDEFTEHHRPEFLMLEWYRSFSNLNAILEDLGGLIKFLGERLEIEVPRLQIMTVRELFKEFVAFDLTPETDASALRSLCRRLEISYTDSDSWDELFFRIFLERIETRLPSNPVVVRDYPPSLAAYARLMESGWADRFELYWNGLEIANAFHEVNDPRVQRERMMKDNERKEALGLEAVKLDQEFFAALESGLPPSGGIALGVERLFMAFHNLKNISEVR